MYLVRSRSCESSISIEYLRALYDAYEAFITDIARVIPVIRVDYSKFRTAEVSTLSDGPLPGALTDTFNTRRVRGLTGNGGQDYGGVQPNCQRSAREVR